MGRYSIVMCNWLSILLHSRKLANNGVESVQKSNYIDCSTSIRDCSWFLNNLPNNNGIAKFYFNLHLYDSLICRIQDCNCDLDSRKRSRLVPCWMSDENVEIRWVSCASTSSPPISAAWKCRVLWNAGFERHVLFVAANELYVRASHTYDDVCLMLGRSPATTIGDFRHCHCSWNQSWAHVHPNNALGL